MVSVVVDSISGDIPPLATVVFETGFSPNYVFIIRPESAYVLVLIQASSPRPMHILLST